MCRAKIPFSCPLYATHFALMLAIFSIHGALVHWRTNVIPLPIGAVVVAVLIGMAWLLV